jgi:hypothetical protein
MSSVCDAPLAEKPIAKPGGERPKGLSRLIHEPPTPLPTNNDAHTDTLGTLTSLSLTYVAQNYVDWTLRAMGSNTVEGGTCNNGKGRDLLGDQSVDGRILLKLA